MKKLIPVIVLNLFLMGCSTNSVFTTFDDVAIDKVYVPKQCPTFVHTFVIPAKRYVKNDEITTMVVMKINDLLYTLETNKKVREEFNNAVIESNKETLEKDDSTSNDRVTKRIYVDRKCPQYTYSPEFKVRKLTPNFSPEVNVNYVVLPEDVMTFHVVKHRVMKSVFNVEVESLNSK